MNAPHPFATRLAAARAMIAGSPSSMPVHLADQFSAAAAETREHHDRLAMVLPLLEPGRRWHQRIALNPSDDVRAYLVAGMLGSETYCCHLRRGGPQPAFVRLPLRRADCGRCAQTIRQSVTAEDECDLCGARGVELFSPFAVRVGPMLVAGDVCQLCADALGIAEKVGA